MHRRRAGCEQFIDHRIENARPPPCRARDEAMETQKCGTPREKLAVPSIGSTTHPRALACGVRAAPSSPTKPSPGNSLASRVAINRSVSPSTSVRKSCGPFIPTVNDDGRRSAPRHLARLARNRLRRMKAQTYLSGAPYRPPLKNGCRSRARTARSAVQTDECKRCVALPDFAEALTSDAGRPGRYLEFGRRCGRNRGQHLIIVAAGDRNLKRSGSARYSRAGGGGKRNTGEIERAR